jgi:hypothetical protein
MAKYYVQSANLRLVLDARTAWDAAVRAVQWCHDRQAEIYWEPGGDRIRDAEVLEWQIGRRITVGEVASTEAMASSSIRHHYLFPRDSLLAQAAYDAERKKLFGTGCALIGAALGAKPDFQA